MRAIIQAERARGGGDAVTTWRNNYLCGFRDFSKEINETQQNVVFSHVKRRVEVIKCFMDLQDSHNPRVTYTN
ncbi:hypothetical protein SR858_10925 [Duganella zoogloeoides]|uniref:Transposase n=1 Tax=Duganella zoogloeoides TaxID=75659 RepID=A0ABZ0Y5S1_9BURK|nr:hypothetical protein [Duganella zoogloeoides]WQH06812.1 hypothetical protein SR858_10925 [Duganella zoogloeoides]